MKTKLKTKHVQLPLLHHRCTPMQRERITPSGATPDALSGQKLALVSSQPSRRPDAYKRGLQIQQEIISLSGLSPRALDLAGQELDAEYEELLFNHEPPARKGSPLVAWCKMLRQRPHPWQHKHGSSLSNLTSVQLLLVWGYPAVTFGLERLSADPSADQLYWYCSDDTAASSIDEAAEALSYAKRVMKSKARRAAKRTTNTSPISYLRVVSQHGAPSSNA